MTNSSDARKEFDVGSVNIEKVAQLAKLCAAGKPAHLGTINERVGVAGNDVVDENDRAHLVPEEWPTAKKAPSSELPRDLRHFLAQIEMIPDKSDFSAGLQAMETSIRAFPPSSSIRGQIPGTIGFFSITALSVIGAILAWHSHGDEAGQMFKRWTSSMGWVSSVSTTKSPAAPAAASTSPEIVQ